MIEQAQYEDVFADLDINLKAQCIPTEWILESWDEYDGRKHESEVMGGVRTAFKVRWRSLKNGGWVSGSLFFNPALLLECGAKWMAEALADMVKGNLLNPKVKPVKGTIDEG